MFLENVDLLKGRKALPIGAKSPDGKRIKTADGWKPVKGQRKGKTTTSGESRWSLPKGHEFVSQTMVGKHNIRTTSYVTPLGYKKRLHTVYDPKGKKLDDWTTKKFAEDSAKDHEKIAESKSQIKGTSKPYTPIKKPITPKMVGTRIMSAKFRNHSLLIMGTGILVAEPSDMPASIRSKIQDLKNQSETSLARQITQFVVTKDNGISVTPHTNIEDKNDTVILANDSGNPAMSGTV